MKLLVLLLSFAAASCAPEYPKCDGDSDCREGEFCVNNKCQQCRDDTDCSAGTACLEGLCGLRQGTCRTVADCGTGQDCQDGLCVSKPQCSTDDDCPEDYECQDGTCVAPPSMGGAGAGQGPCELVSLYFDFNESLLTTDATEGLQRNSECLKSAPARGRRIRIEGHCDPRGTEEYNMALGDRRARTALAHLTRLGVSPEQVRPVSKGKLEAQGADEASWALDRRADFIWE